MFASGSDESEAFAEVTARSARPVYRSDVGDTTSTKSDEHERTGAIGPLCPEVAASSGLVATTVPMAVAVGLQSPAAGPRRRHRQGRAQGDRTEQQCAHCLCCAR